MAADASIAGCSRLRSKGPCTRYSSNHITSSYKIGAASPSLPSRSAPSSRCQPSRFRLCARPRSVAASRQPRVSARRAKKVASCWRAASVQLSTTTVRCACRKRRCLALLQPRRALRGRAQPASRRGLLRSSGRCSSRPAKGRLVPGRLKRRGRGRLEA